MLALAVAGLLIGYGAAWLALLAGVWVAAVMWLLKREAVGGELRMVPETAGGCRWYWRTEAEGEWQDVALRCRYLGPWLMALELNGRTFWLWPDSSHVESLRQLRCQLIQAA
ncbi:hypothetical protein [Billgrantia endophytica]|uniref:Toxin CptA n=1 Tax=Billgrantia endophytica TaxID=2033802 RepID=A0A2N7U9C2_9GAMM|nr:hypothetical protein [Halomonas endophytica]PMR77027.1 hypothetical protein C1H69_04855 [Halomonas endophytica]